jgi:hypothetical protein
VLANRRCPGDEALLIGIHQLHEDQRDQKPDVGGQRRKADRLDRQRGAHQRSGDDGVQDHVACDGQPRFAGEQPERAIRETQVKREERERDGVP